MIGGLLHLLRRQGAWFAAIAVACMFVAGGAVARAPSDAPLAEVPVAELPREARDTIVLIRKGGPFPYARDGIEFGNRERLLPRQPKGYYREYTVKTPGSRDRGARRIVAGVPNEFYYTDDHYKSFRRVRE